MNLATFFVAGLDILESYAFIQVAWQNQCGSIKSDDFPNNKCEMYLDRNLKNLECEIKNNV